LLLLVSFSALPFLLYPFQGISFPACLYLKVLYFLQISELILQVVLFQCVFCLCI
jgi:hypothetical protein